MQPGIYQHYKGGKYFVFGLVRHTETREDMVLYMPLYEHPEGGRVWQARPLSNWNAPQDGRPRFVYLGETLKAASKPEGTLL